MDIELIVIAGLLCVCAILAVVCLKLWMTFKRTRIELTRFGEIDDLEKHAIAQKAKADFAIGEKTKAQADSDRLTTQIAAQTAMIQSQESHISDQKRELAGAAQLFGQYETLDKIAKKIDEQKQAMAQYSQVLGNFKTSADLKAYISQQKSQIAQLTQTIGRFDTVAALDQQIATSKGQVVVHETRVRELQDVLGGVSTLDGLNARIRTQQQYLAGIQAQATQVEEAIEMQEFGFYRPHFDFDSSSKYEDKLDDVRNRQTATVKGNTAIDWEKTWTVEGSEAQGRRMMQEQGKLMLRAFNGECDAAVAKVKYNNATTLESRIRKAWEQINKLGKTNTASITEAFLDLKLQELYLVHEHRVKQQEEKEEQQRIREQMKEEEKAQREIEDAQEIAAKDEQVAQRALERATAAFENATRSHAEVTEQTRAQNEALAAQVAKLENELKDAIDRKAKAIARAQLTRSGHVYILSNVGSFGEDLYKLGLTRRLDPYERVKELGDASVPFPFDVHAIIYSEDAPALELKLHKHFEDRRVNLINFRREYFRVTLDEVMAAVKKLHGEITFVKHAEAAEYRETVAKRKAFAPPVPPVIDEIKQVALAPA